MPTVPYIVRLAMVPWIVIAMIPYIVMAMVCIGFIYCNGHGPLYCNSHGAMDYNSGMLEVVVIVAVATLCIVRFGLHFLRPYQRGFLCIKLRKTSP